MLLVAIVCLPFRITPWLESSNQGVSNVAIPKAVLSHATYSKQGIAKAENARKNANANAAQLQNGYASERSDSSPASALEAAVAQTIVVEFRPEVDPEVLADAVGGQLVRREPGNFASVKVSGDSGLAIAKLKAIPGVLSVEKSRILKVLEESSVLASVTVPGGAANPLSGAALGSTTSAITGSTSGIVSGTSTSEDPDLGRQWGLSVAQVPEAWDLGADGKGITIAIVDTGVDLNHPDLKDKVVPGYNAILDSTNSYDLQDRNGHGTHVAGIAAAAKGNGYGIVGVAYNAKIMPIKTMNRDGEGQDTDIARGIRWAVDHGAKIINLSLGSDAEESVLKSAVQYALSKNLLVIAAAGNYDSGNNPGVSYPAADPGVMAVGAVDQQSAIADFSVSGPKIALTAPGVEILSDYWDATLGSTYAWMDGTSMASPFVSGAAALVWSKHLDWGAEQVRQALENGAKDLGEPGRDQVFGYGLVDPYRALQVSTPISQYDSPANISVAGGMVQGTGGVGLKVPAQAFATDMTVTIQNIGNPGDLPAGIVSGGSPFQVQWKALQGSTSSGLTGASLGNALGAATPLKMLSLAAQMSAPKSGKAGFLFHWSGSRWINVGGGESVGTVTAGIYDQGIYRLGYQTLPTTSRIAGADRLSTAIQIAEAAYPTGADTVILARSDDFPDALAGVPLAYKLHAPILLTPSDHLADLVWQEIDKLAPQKIILLGGNGALSPSVESRAATIAATERLAGNNRYETAGIIAKALGTRGEAFLVNGDNFPDALSAAAAAALSGDPILLTSANALPSATDQTLRSLSVSHVTIVGGEGVVSAAQLNNFPGMSRLAGVDRYGTAAAVLSAFPPQGSEIFVATGEDFPDALAGGVLAAIQTSAIMLVPPMGLPSTQQSLLQSWGSKLPIALGGSSVVSDTVLNQVVKIR